MINRIEPVTEMADSAVYGQAEPGSLTDLCILNKLNEVIAKINELVEVENRRIDQANHSWERS